MPKRNARYLRHSKAQHEIVGHFLLLLIIRIFSKIFSNRAALVSTGANFFLVV